MRKVKCIDNSGRGCKLELGKVYELASDWYGPNLIFVIVDGLSIAWQRHRFQLLEGE